jgi:hypothetical protein
MLIKKIFRKIKDKLYFFLRASYIIFCGIDIDKECFKDFIPKCKFLFDDAQKNNCIDELIKQNKHDEIIKDANKICSHVFNLLGSGDKYLGESLPWNKDFKTGFVWKNKFHKNIRIVDLNNNSDVKVPWELSRFQHFFTLGKAYLLTNDEKYSLEFKNEIQDWIKNNPVEMSVNWTCTMDVAIRTVNWIIGYFFFEGSKSISEDFWTEFHKSLYIHGRYIIKNLENKVDYTGNHYLSNIVGLIWLGTYFGEFSVEDKNNNPMLWLSYGVKELEKEMFVQVNEDGTNYEASTSYHRLVTELFLLTTVLCNKNAIKFSSQYMNRLEKMCEFIMDITKPNGLSPLIGDADDGRLAIVSNYSSWVRRDFSHILAIAGEYFNRDEFRYYGKQYKEDAMWIVGSFKENVDVPEKLKSKAYKDGGYYILRNERMYCLIRCGELSFRGQGCHSHNDQLSFELNVDGEDFIVDPGVYGYTSDYKIRNLYRTTEMHNTLAIAGYEQNQYDKYNLFYMKEQTFAECLQFDENKFVGRHFGYKDKCGVVHERNINLFKNRIEIIDIVNIGENYNINLNFSLDSNVKIDIKNNRCLMVNNNKYINLVIENENMKEVYRNIAYGYGYAEESKALIVEGKGKNKITSHIEVV